MTNMRAFIAVELPTEIQVKLEEIKKELALPGSRSVRWVLAQNTHLTLKFLGEIPDTDIEKIDAILSPHLRTFKSFSVHLSNLGAFPNLKHPKVLWIGIQTSQDIVRLQATIDDRLLQIKYAKEDRPFHPHLTLGRVSEHADSREIEKVTSRMSEGKIDITGELPVDHVQLFRSDLKPSGPVYSLIHSWHFS